MVKNVAVFFSYLGDQTSKFATGLSNKGYAIEVVNDVDCHSCFTNNKIKHEFKSNIDVAAHLANLYQDGFDKTFDCAVILMKCAVPLSSEGFDQNLQLRRIASVLRNVWILSDHDDVLNADLHIGLDSDYAQILHRKLACKLLNGISEYDSKVTQAIKDNMMFPLEEANSITSSESSDLVEVASRSRASSHPELPTQPLCTPGKSDADGLYKNSFGRRGKDLFSEVFVKRGIMKEVDTYYTQFLPAASLKAKNFVVVDEICAEIIDIDALFVQALGRVGVHCEKLILPSRVADESGETSTEPYKNNEEFTRCVDTILSHGVSKHSCIISVGGGVINNLCGVLAGLIYRGIHLVHFTTTTMGMLDAALDFKQAINHDLGKNLLGCYYPAEKIVIDPESCLTLSARHIRNGLAEALKHGLCQSRELMERIVQPVRDHGEEILRDPGYIEDICKLSIEIKVPTLDHYGESDFNEMCPQYGHAVGHAVESLSWTHSHEPLLHGEAVAIGMCVSAEIAHKRGYCSAECLEEHYRNVLDLGLPAHIPASMSAEMILKKIVHDKHFVQGIPSMGLAAEIGEMAYDTQNTSFAFGVEQDELICAINVNMARCMFCTPCY